MTDFQLNIPIPLAAGVAAAYAVWLLWILLVRGRVLANRDAALTSAMMQSADRERASTDLSDRLAAAGLDLTPATFGLIRLATAASGLVLALALRLPSLVLIAAAVAGWAGPLAWLDQRRTTREKSIDDDLPAALSGLAATLAISQSLGEALAAAADAVSPAGDPHPRLLALELRRTAAAISASGQAETALADLQRRSPSPTLAMTAFNLRVYAEAGGGHFTAQVIATATRVRSMLEGRQRARAFAGGAQAAVVLIIGLTVGLGLLGLQDPGFAAFYQSGAGAVVLIGVAGAMAVGYSMLRGLIQDVG